MNADDLDADDLDAKLRGRWRDLVEKLVAAQPGATREDKAERAGALLGVNRSTVFKYIPPEEHDGPKRGRPRNERKDGKPFQPVFPLPHVLARACRRLRWNVNYVLCGPPHPEYVEELAPRPELAHALARYVETELVSATDRGELAPLPPTVLGAVARSIASAAADMPGESWQVNGPRLLADVARRATAHAAAIVDAIRTVRGERRMQAAGLEMLAAKQAATGGALAPEDRAFAEALLADVQAHEARVAPKVRAAVPEADYLSVRGLGAAPPAPEPRGALAVVTGAPAGR